MSPEQMCQQKWNVEIQIWPFGQSQNVKKTHYMDSDLDLNRDIETEYQLFKIMNISFLCFKYKKLFKRILKPFGLFPILYDKKLTFSVGPLLDFTKDLNNIFQPK